MWSDRRATTKLTAVSSPPMVDKEYGAVCVSRMQPVKKYSSSSDYDVE